MNLQVMFQSLKGLILTSTCCFRSFEDVNVSIPQSLILTFFLQEGHLFVTCFNPSKV